MSPAPLVYRARSSGRQPWLALTANLGSLLHSARLQGALKPEPSPLSYLHAPPLSNRVNDFQTQGWGNSELEVIRRKIREAEQLPFLLSSEKTARSALGARSCFIMVYGCCLNEPQVIKDTPHCHYLSTYKFKKITHEARWPLRALQNNQEWSLHGRIGERMERRRNTQHLAQCSAHRRCFR